MCGFRRCCIFEIAIIKIAVILNECNEVKNPVELQNDARSSSKIF